MNPDGSVSVDDPEVIKSFTDNPDFPYLVSFSRTGSHWLRMIMELYFEKPSLVRAFYFKDANDFTCYHTHDMDLELRRENVIYLYRNPVETVYSQLCYYKEDPDDRGKAAGIGPISMPGILPSGWCMKISPGRKPSSPMRV